MDLEDPTVAPDRELDQRIGILWIGRCGPVGETASVTSGESFWKKQKAPSYSQAMQHDKKS
jgi:hypothetical protein